LPDLHGGEPEDTYLMIIPTREIAYLERSFVFRAIKSIYLSMYHNCDELDLLDFTIDCLPPRIRLT
ncbi:MAG: hypothetical protein WCF07_03425, partial [Nitrososphaeraceae archaeon]